MCIFGPGGFRVAIWYFISPCWAVAKRDKSILGRRETRQVYFGPSRNTTALCWSVAKRDSYILGYRETPKPIGRQLGLVVAEFVTVPICCRKNCDCSDWLSQKWFRMVVANMVCSNLILVEMQRLIPHIPHSLFSIPHMVKNKKHVSPP